MYQYGVRRALIRYTYASLDKYLLNANMKQLSVNAQYAAKSFIDIVEKIEKQDCEEYRIVYINFLLHEVNDAVMGVRIRYASDLYGKLDIRDNSTLKNLVQKAFVLGKLKRIPIAEFFSFLEGRQHRAPKRKAKSNVRGGGGRKRRKRL